MGLWIALAVFAVIIILIASAISMPESPAFFGRIKKPWDTHANIPA